MIIRSSWFLDRISWFFNISGITLFPFIILRDEDYNRIRINHEKIHLRQQLEMLVIPFYIWYIIEGLFKGYRNISLEKEAYDNQHNLHYLNTRPFWAFLI